MKKLRNLRLISFFAIAVLSVPLVAPPQAQAAAISITAASFVPSTSALYLPGRHYAGTTITQGQAVYIDSAVTTITNGDIKLASATGTGDAVKVIGFAANGASAGQPIRVLIRDPSLTLGGTVAAGAVVYLHSTAGAVTSIYADLTTGGYVSVIGVGIGSNKINFGGTKIATAQFAGVIRADVAIP